MPAGHRHRLERLSNRKDGKKGKHRLNTFRRLQTVMSNHGRSLTQGRKGGRWEPIGIDRDPDRHTQHTQSACERPNNNGEAAVMEYEKDEWSASHENLGFTESSQNARMSGDRAFAFSRGYGWWGLKLSPPSALHSDEPDTYISPLLQKASIRRDAPYR